MTEVLKYLESNYQTYISEFESVLTLSPEEYLDAEFIRDLVDQGPSFTYLISKCGVGKTYMFQSGKFQRNNCRVLFITPLRAILSQISKEGSQTKTLIAHSGDDLVESENVTVVKTLRNVDLSPYTTVFTTYNQIGNIENIDQFNYTVLDEIHVINTSLDSRYQAIATLIKKLRLYRGKILGMSATQSSELKSIQTLWGDRFRKVVINKEVTHEPDVKLVVTDVTSFVTKVVDLMKHGKSQVLAFHQNKNIQAKTKSVQDIYMNRKGCLLDVSSIQADQDNTALDDIRRGVQSVDLGWIWCTSLISDGVSINPTIPVIVSIDNAGKYGLCGETSIQAMNRVRNREMVSGIVRIKDPSSISELDEGSARKTRQYQLEALLRDENDPDLEVLLEDSIEYESYSWSLQNFYNHARFNGMKVSIEKDYDLTDLKMSKHVELKFINAVRSNLGFLSRIDEMNIVNRDDLLEPTSSEAGEYNLRYKGPAFHECHLRPYNNLIVQVTKLLSYFSVDQVRDMVSNLNYDLSKAVKSSSLMHEPEVVELAVLDYFVRNGFRSENNIEVSYSILKQYNRELSVLLERDFKWLEETISRRDQLKFLDYRTVIRKVLDTLNYNVDEEGGYITIYKIPSTSGQVVNTASPYLGSPLFKVNVFEAYGRSKYELIKETNEVGFDFSSFMIDTVPKAIDVTFKEGNFYLISDESGLVVESFYMLDIAYWMLANQTKLEWTFNWRLGKLPNAKNLSDGLKDRLARLQQPLVGYKLISTK